MEPYSLKRSILSALAYFQVFDHPLAEDEIFIMSDLPGADVGNIKIALDLLVKEELIFEWEGYYTIVFDRKLVQRRFKANIRAKQKMRTAWRHAKIIAYCPFVEAVMISGSLSKGVLHEKDDIDFFIITQKGRLMIAKALLTFFKRVFLFNSYRNFCLNYFVDVDHLEINERNLFAATEVASVLPMYNEGLYYQFIEQNDWIRHYFPRFKPKLNAKPIPRKRVSRVFEWLLKGKAGDRVDNYALNITKAYINRKYKHLSKDQFSDNLILHKGVSRIHPDGHQSRIMFEYERIMQEIDKKL